MVVGRGFARIVDSGAWLCARQAFFAPVVGVPVVVVV